MPRLDSILPLLVRARASMERGYEAFIQIAEQGEALPCDAVAVYTRLRRDVLRLEGAIVTEAKLRGLHPPEDVPRSFALLGGCPPRASEVKLDKEQVALGKTYLDGVRQIGKLSDEAVRKAFDVSPEFADHARKLVEYLAPFAKAGTDEAAPAPPRNLMLLRLLYFLGGKVWPMPDGDRLWRMDMNVTMQDAVAVYQEAAQFEAAATAFKEESEPPPPLLPKWGWGLLIAGGVAAAGGSAFAIHRMSRRPVGEQPWNDLPEGSSAEHEGA